MQNFKSKFQHLFLISVLLFFGFLILGASVYGQVAPREPDPTPVEEEKVDYQLVYPGILPDHFLYPLKMVRDRAWLLLTTGPERKAQVMLLFADKRLGAGRALIEGGKENLGITTLTKGEKYLEQAVAQLQQAKDKGEDLGELNEELTRAVAKHQEVLGELKEKVSTDQWGLMDQMLEKTKALRVEILL